MKRYLALFLALVLGFSVSTFGQCFSNPLFTALGLPGVYPPEIPIPNIPLSGIADGSVGDPYSQILTVVNLTDTSMDISSFLPTAAVTAMNAAGISTTMSLNVNHTIYNIGGLPNGLNFICDQTNCEFISSVSDGCILLNGIPVEAGSFDVGVEMIINVQIPAITDPILGVTIFPGMSQDLPVIPAVNYDLQISGATAIGELSNRASNVYPIPSTGIVYVDLQYNKTIRVLDALGRQVYTEKMLPGVNQLPELVLSKGIYFLEIFDKNNIEKHRILIN